MLPAILAQVLTQKSSQPNLGSRSSSMAFVAKTRTSLLGRCTASAAHCLCCHESVPPLCRDYSRTDALPTQPYDSLANPMRTQDRHEALAWERSLCMSCFSTGRRSMVAYLVSGPWHGVDFPVFTDPTAHYGPRSSIANSYLCSLPFLRCIAGRSSGALKRPRECKPTLLLGASDCLQ